MVQEKIPPIERILLRAIKDAHDKHRYDDDYKDYAKPIIAAFNKCQQEMSRGYAIAMGSWAFAYYQAWAAACHARNRDEFDAEKDNILETLVQNHRARLEYELNDIGKWFDFSANKDWLSTITPSKLEAELSVKIPQYIKKAWDINQANPGLSMCFSTEHLGDHRFHKRNWTMIEYDYFPGGDFRVRPKRAEQLGMVQVSKQIQRRREQLGLPDIKLLCFAYHLDSALYLDSGGAIWVSPPIEHSEGKQPRAHAQLDAPVKIANRIEDLFNPGEYKVSGEVLTLSPPEGLTQEQQPAKHYQAKDDNFAGNYLLATILTVEQLWWGDSEIICSADTYQSLLSRWLTDMTNGELALSGFQVVSEDSHQLMISITVNKKPYKINLQYSEWIDSDIARQLTAIAVDQGITERYCVAVHADSWGQELGIAWVTEGQLERLRENGFLVS